MRIGLNATCYDDRPSGAVQRFRGLYRALAVRRPDYKFIVYEPSDSNPSAAFSDLPNFRAVKTSVRVGGMVRRWVTDGGRLRSQLRADRLDLFEMFNQPLIVPPNCPAILTVHDFRRAERGSPGPARLFRRRVMRRSYSRAAMTITVSKTMGEKLDLLFPGTRSTTLYNGLDLSEFKPRSSVEINEVRTRFGLHAPYILTVGHLEARKNIARLVQSMSHLSELGRDEHLVVVGADHGDLQRIIRVIDANGLHGKVHVLSGVDDETLRRLYQGAALVSIPSLYEGFGIPLIEAMASRTPLICSDIPVFLELTQACGVYYDPFDTWDIATQTAHVLRTPNARKALIGYGARRVEEDFTFDVLAGELQRIYETVLAGS